MDKQRAISALLIFWAASWRAKFTAS